MTIDKNHRRAPATKTMTPASTALDEDHGVHETTASVRAQEISADRQRRSQPDAKRKAGDESL